MKFKATPDMTLSELEKAYKEHGDIDLSNIFNGKNCEYIRFRCQNMSVAELEKAYEELDGLNLTELCDELDLSKMNELKSSGGIDGTEGKAARGVPLEVDFNINEFNVCTGGHFHNLAKSKNNKFDCEYMDENYYLEYLDENGYLEYLDDCEGNDEGKDEEKDEEECVNYAEFKARSERKVKAMTESLKNEMEKQLKLNLRDTAEKKEAEKKEAEKERPKELKRRGKRLSR
jgi:hypothetical protein